MMATYGTVFNIIAAAFKTFPDNCKEKQAKIYEKIREAKKNFADFLRFFEKKQVKKALFLRFFEENLMRINTINKHSCFHTMPSVSRKKLKKVPKKVLT